MSAYTQRATKCSHGHPNVLRLRDERIADDTFVRVLDCVECGRYAIPLDINDLEKFSRLQLQFLGENIAIPVDKVAEFREKEYAKNRSGIGPDRAE